MGMNPKLNEVVRQTLFMTINMELLLIIQVDQSSHGLKYHFALKGCLTY